jgi:phage baseplate assembly protein gpV
MADKKVTQLTALTTPTAPDLLMIVDDPNGTPVSKKITLKSFFGAVTSNTVFSANVTVSGNRVQLASNVNITKTLTANTVKITLGSTPASNNATTVGMAIGEMRFTNTYIYIAVNATTIKRVALSRF